MKKKKRERNGDETPPTYKIPPHESLLSPGACAMETSASRSRGTATTFECWSGYRLSGLDDIDGRSHMSEKKTKSRDSTSSLWAMETIGKRGRHRRGSGRKARIEMR
jgi:hypothetical protein